MTSSSTPVTASNSSLMTYLGPNAIITITLSGPREVATLVVWTAARQPFLRLHQMYDGWSGRAPELRMARPAKM